MQSLEEGLKETVSTFRDVISDMPAEDHKYSQEVLGLLLKGFYSTGDDSGKGLFEKDIEIIDNLLAAYRNGNRSAITETVTGGSFYSMDREKELIGFNPWNIFHNETIVNHLGQVKRDYLRFKGLFKYTTPTPFFERLERLADEYSEIAIQIKSDIFTDSEFRNCYDACSQHVTSREDVRAKYLDVEFKRKDIVVDLLKKLDSFYGVVSLFVERILENQSSK